MKFNIDVDPKYKELIIDIKTDKIDEQLATILKMFEQQNKELTITGKHKDKIYVIEPSDIYLFYSQNRKVYASTKKQTIEVKKTLYALEEELDQSVFVRISKSAIVNIKHISTIEVTFNGSLMVKFDNGMQEIISRRYVAKVKEFIGLGGN